MIRNNTAYFGGFITAEAAVIYILNSNFTANFANKEGGVIYSNSSIYYSSILQNIKDIRITNNIFINNTANKGGTMSIFDFKFLIISQTLFSRNYGVN